MKRRTLLISWIALTLLIPLAAYAAYATYAAFHHEEPRPYFASYSERGGWLCGGNCISLRDNRSVYYDLEENVLLVVQQEPTPSVVRAYHDVWLVDGEPPGPVLRIRRQDDDLVRTIEWRRDCIITLDREGTPTYTSLSPQALHRAFDTPYDRSPAVGELIDSVTRPTTLPTTRP